MNKDEFLDVLRENYKTLIRLQESQHILQELRSEYELKQDVVPPYIYFF